MQQRQDK